PGADTYKPSGEARVRYSAEERRRYALAILEDTQRNRGYELAPILLKDYFRGRGITSVPPTALVALCWRLNGDEGYLPDCPAMIFPIVDNARTLGIHVTWLNGDLTHKLERKMYGPIRGGYVELYKGKHDAAQRLIIGEGVENALAAAQLAGLP